MVKMKESLFIELCPDIADLYIYNINPQNANNILVLANGKNVKTNGKNEKLIITIPIAIKNTFTILFIYYSIYNFIYQKIIYSY